MSHSMEPSGLNCVCAIIDRNMSSASLSGSTDTKKGTTYWDGGCSIFMQTMKRRFVILYEDSYLGS